MPPLQFKLLCLKYNLLESDSEILDVKKEGIQILNSPFKNLPQLIITWVELFQGDGFKKDYKMALVHFQPLQIWVMGKHN